MDSEESNAMTNISVNFEDDQNDEDVDDNGQSVCEFCGCVGHSDDKRTRK